MEGAFTHMGNHLVSDSAATINAGDVDEGILDGDLSRGRLSRRRRADDDEEYDDDDAESMASVPMGGRNGQSAMRAEDAEDAEVELPPHACT